MTNEAAHALWVAWKRGGSQNAHMLDRLIGGHRGIAASVSADFVRGCPDHVSADDVHGAALVGLWKAARTWNPDKGPFTSHAWRRVRGEILDEARKAMWFGRYIRDWPGSLDLEMHDADGGVESRAYSLPDPHEPLEDYVAARETGRRVLAAIARLPERRRLALEAQILDDGESRRLAARIGVSESRVSQLARKARQTIREELAA